MVRDYNPQTKTAYCDTEKQFLDLETGEIKTTIETKAIRYGRPKYYRATKGAFYKALSALDGSAIKVALFIADNCNHENVFLGTYKDIEQSLLFSNKTVIVSMAKVQEQDIIRMIHPAQWMFNPNLAVSCYDDAIPVLVDKYFSLPSYAEKQLNRTRKDNKDVT